MHTGPLLVHGSGGSRWFGRRLSLLLAIAISAALLAACDGGETGPSPTDGTPTDQAGNVEISDWGGIINPGGDPVSGGALRIDLPADPASASPLFYLANPDNVTGMVALQIFDQLVEYLPGSLDPAPGLAESWEVTDDGLMYTFHLRDAQFSDGTSVTSADVEFVLDAARGGVDLDGTGAESFFADHYGRISQIETPDEKTVVLQLKEPFPSLIYFLAYVAVSIVPSDLVNEIGVEAFNEHPIGSGPFLFESYTRDQEVVLVRNPNYWRESQPYLDEIRYTITPDDNTRVLNIQSGNVDVADRIPFGQVETVNNSDNAEVLVAPGGDMNVIWVNNSKEPFGESVVRQALNYATPVDSIIDVVFAGLADRMNTVMPRMKYWPDDVEPYPYDPEKAKELLAQSSVPDGFSTTIIIPSEDTASKQEAQIIQEAWKDLGIDVQIRPLDDATSGDAFGAGEYELMLFPPGPFTTDIPVEDEFAALLFDFPAINNFFTWYENEEVTALVQQALVETDEAKRAELWHEVHVKSMADPMNVPLTYTPGRAAVANNVHDFNYLMGGLFRLETVWID